MKDDKPITDKELKEVAKRLAKSRELTEFEKRNKALIATIKEVPKKEP